MSGVDRSVKIILKNLIYIPFIGDSADFFIRCHRTGDYFFSIQHCMKCTDLLIFTYRCCYFIRKFCFPYNCFCFFQKISFRLLFLRQRRMYFNLLCNCSGYAESLSFSGYGLFSYGTASVTVISGRSGRSGRST